MVFSEHGHYYLQADKQIIIFHCGGEWNLETSEMCIQQFNLLLENVNSAQFALIIDSLNIMGTTSDALTIWKPELEKWQQRGFNAMVRIDDSESTKYQMFMASFDQQLKKTMPFQYQQQIEPGLQWLHSQGFSGFEQGFKTPEFIQTI